MSLSTLIIAEPDSDKIEEIKSLVKGNPSISSIGVVSMSKAIAEIGRAYPQIAWIELSGQSDKGVALLKSIKLDFPDVYCLVSNQTLDPQLLRTCMQSGAFDFLDAETWSGQLGDVIDRLAAEEKARAKEEAKREQMLRQLEARKVNPSASFTNLESVKKMRGGVSGPAAAPGEGIQKWQIISFLLAAIVVFLIFFR